jgi:hypothetical protein
MTNWVYSLQKDMEKIKRDNPIFKIDETWQKYVAIIEKKYQENRLPDIEGKFKCTIDKHYLIYWEDQVRTIEVNKLIYNKKIYGIVTPLIFKLEFGVMFNKAKTQIGLTGNPMRGFHIFPHNDLRFPPTFCLGEYILPNILNKYTLKEFVDNVVKIYSVINMNSLGRVVITKEECKDLKTWDNIQKVDPEVFVKMLLEKEKINPLL